MALFTQNYIRRQHNRSQKQWIQYIERTSDFALFNWINICIGFCWVLPESPPKQQRHTKIEKIWKRDAVRCRVRRQGLYSQLYHADFNHNHTIFGNVAKGKADASYIFATIIIIALPLLHEWKSLDWNSQRNIPILIYKILPIRIFVAEVKVLHLSPYCSNEKFIVSGANSFVWEWKEL